MEQKGTPSIAEYIKQGIAHTINLETYIQNGDAETEEETKAMT